MFYNCANLNTITLGYTGNFAGAPSNAFLAWVYGVAASGTFYYNGSDTTTGTSAIPVGWTVLPIPVPTKVKYTAASGLPDWEGDIVGELSGRTTNPYYTTLIPDVLSADNIQIGNQVTSIGRWAFNGCSGLSSVTIPNSVTSLGDGVFINCSGLMSVTIPGSITSIGMNVFSGCSGLTSATIENGVTSIGGNMFYNCRNLTSVTIPDSVTSIGNGAFHSCIGLTSVTIPNSVTSIGSNAFLNCSGLSSITLPANVVTIGSGSFNGCSALSSVTMTGKNIDTVKGMTNYSWSLPYGCVLHCSDGDISLSGPEWTDVQYVSGPDGHFLISGILKGSISYKHSKWTIKATTQITNVSTAQTITVGTSVTSI